nr:hypothetical protein CFP56_09115 [Quercus suber]
MDGVGKFEVNAGRDKIVDVMAKKSYNAHWIALARMFSVGDDNLTLMVGLRYDKAWRFENLRQHSRETHVKAQSSSQQASRDGGERVRAGIMLRTEVKQSLRDSTQRSNEVVHQRLGHVKERNGRCCSNCCCRTSTIDVDSPPVKSEGRQTVKSLDNDRTGCDVAIGLDWQPHMCIATTISDYKEMVAS